MEERSTASSIRDDLEHSCCGVEQGVNLPAVDDAVPTCHNAPQLDAAVPLWHGQIVTRSKRPRSAKAL
jgi:hypothetical protein